MSQSRKFVVSIAGFDPTNGAGIGADLKTFEQNGVYGLGVCTAITIQTEDTFERVEWVDLNTITAQIDTLLAHYPVSVAKIGLIENFDVLEEVIFCLKEKNPEIKIIWDPILKSSSGFVFHEEVYSKQLKNLLKDIYVVTPNRKEVVKLSPADTPEKAARQLSSQTNVYLKDGHNTTEQCTDRLFSGREEFEFSSERAGYSKHGSGCVFSAALAAQLALDIPLRDACANAKNYITRFISSHPSKLGSHYPQEVPA